MLQLLLSARRKLGLTQEDMAKRLGISRNYLALIETGKRKVPPSVADQLVTIGKVDVTEEHSLEPQRDPVCHDCAAKDARILELERERDFLRGHVASLVSKLPDAKPSDAADRASGVRCGGTRTRQATA